MKFISNSKRNKEISTEIFPPLLLKPTDKCTRVMPKAKKGEYNVLILKKTTELDPYA